MGIDAQIFKSALAQWSTGITVISTLDDENWIGLTASSFTSVSLNPPLVLVCIGKNLYTHQVLEQSQVFSVSILQDTQLEIAKIFAGMTDTEDRFAGLDCHTAQTGCPILPDVLAWVDCEVRHIYEAGDHSIFVGEVVQADIPNPNGEALAYHNRSWGKYIKLD
jgi:flavin reductase (DIM6/NTAB) family NADH-FMN oxidoreductase RutF